MNQQIAEAIQEAEMVLVGIGEEFAPELPENWGGITDGNKGSEEDPEDSLENLETAGKIKLSPYLESKFYGELPQDHPVLRAYDCLREAIGEKPYFVVTLNMDDLIYRSKFGAEVNRTEENGAQTGGNALFGEYVVAPCGSMGKLQCGEHMVEAAGIREQILAEASAVSFRIQKTTPKTTPKIQSEEQTENRISEYGTPEKKNGNHPGKPGTLIEIIDKYARCPICGRPLSFHTIHTEGYLESGYLPQWEKYRSWLARTLNKKLCVLELGVGFQYPQVIRWPFEKTAFYNQKAYFVRVHSKFPQTTQELAGRAVAIQGNPVEELLRT